MQNSFGHLLFISSSGNPRPISASQAREFAARLQPLMTIGNRHITVSRDFKKQTVNVKVRYEGLRDENFIVGCYRMPVEAAHLACVQKNHREGSVIGTE